MFAANGGAVSNDKTYIEDVFSTYLYTGNGSTQTINNGLNLVTSAPTVSFSYPTAPAGFTSRCLLTDVCVSPSGRYVAVGSNYFITSTDGVNWTSPQFIPLDPNINFIYSYTMQSVAVNSSGLFVAVANQLFNSSYIFLYSTSTDGVNWQPMRQGYPPISPDEMKLTVNSAGLFVAVGNKSGRPVNLTFNGTTWTGASDYIGSTVFAVLQDITATSSGGFVAVGYGSTANEQYPFYSTSTNGTTWTTPARMAGSTTVAFMLGVAVNSAGRFVAVGYDAAGAAVYSTSTNGTSWSTPALMNGFSGVRRLRAVSVNSADKFVAVGENGAYSTSEDGTTWTTPAVLSSDVVFYGVAPTSGGNFVAVGAFPSTNYTPATSISTNSIPNVSDGGLVWIKARSGTSSSHQLIDTKRGVNTVLNSDTTSISYATSNFLNEFNTNGFTVGTNLSVASTTYASWTFRKAPKFFDVVTYTGNGVSGRAINHSLGVEPSMILIKNLTTIGNPQNWCVYIRTYANQTGLVWTMPGTDAAQGSNDFLNTPTAFNFTVNNYQSNNWSGTPYVAYLFAHDTSVDGLIQCGTYVGNGSTTGPTINLGWEPQFLITKQAYVGTSNWSMFDNMRGMPVGSADSVLYANAISAESSASDFVTPTATGFQVVSTSSDVNTSGRTYFYMAIRRGPMRTPTNGYSVFNSTFGTSGAPWFKSGFPTDMAIFGGRSNTDKFYNAARLISGKSLRPNTTAAETDASGYTFDYQNGYVGGTGSNTTNYISWNFRRAPGFFDVVCYTGTGVARTVNHNLGVAPELVIVKSRSTTENWTVYNNSITATKYLYLNSSMASDTFAGWWNNTEPTSNTFSLGTGAGVNGSGANYVAYLFASCPGVSKVGSYTGNGSSQTINCGFTNGARFVLIKRVNVVGDWHVMDTARGIVASNDPILYLNSTVAEVTGYDPIDPDSSGFVVNQSDFTPLNAVGSTYIYLAIA